MGVLDGKVAIVTGGGQGVGRGIALALAREGAAIAVAGRTESKLVDVCGEIRSFGGRAHPVTADVCLAEDIDLTLDETIKTFGGVDILVNNAQIVVFGPIAELTEQDWAGSIDSGPRATIRFMKAVRPHMIARGGGSIINLSSGTTVSWNDSGWAFYSAAKQAIRALSRTAAVEWGPDNIRVNNIAPVANSPAMERRHRDYPHEARAYIQRVPLRRIGDLEKDIGRVAVFLAGPDSCYVTGVTLPVDGGMCNFH